MTSERRSKVISENRKWVERILSQVREQVYDAIESPSFYGRVEITAIVQDSKVIGFDTSRHQTVRERGFAKPKQ